MWVACMVAKAGASNTSDKIAATCNKIKCLVMQNFVARITPP